MMNKSMTEIKFAQIDELLESNNCYLIDILPLKINGDYSKLESYLLENDLKGFAKKISGIIIKLMHYFKPEIYKLALLEGESTISDNYANKDLIELATIIIDTIESGKNFWMQIIFSGENTFLISLNGQFSVEVYNASSSDLDLISILVKQEGLFIRVAE